ncbi:dipeptidase [soil metagenome]
MCDTLVSLTDDGVLFAKNSDRDPNESQVLRWHPAADHAPGDEVRCTWISVPQVGHTNAVVLSQPWWMWGAEMGANEHGVTIGNEAVFTKRPKGETALLGMDLLRLGLERSRTAAEAVQVMVGLLEAHGQGGACSHEHPGFTYHNSFLVADASGAIVLETADSHWATEQVAGPGRSISNGLTIAGFAEAHADRLRGRVASCSLRRARTEASAARATTPADLMAALRDHGDDPSPHWSPLNGALAAPCAHAGGKVTSTQTTSSWVADLRSGPLHWVTATSAPCTSLFKPVRVDQRVDLGPDPTNHSDLETVWWRHEQLHRLTLRDHAASSARSAAARHRTEARWQADPPTTLEAFAQAEELEAAWLADLVHARLPERRPRWLRSLWSDLDAAAGIPTVPEPATQAGASAAAS